MLTAFFTSRRSPHGRAVTTADPVAAYYELNRKVYGVFTGWYDPVARPLRGLRREVARIAGAAPGVRVLDVATGTGEQALAFGAAGAQVVGIDLSEAMLARARRKNTLPNVTFQQSDATALPFDDDSFDVVSVSLALHEMPPPIRARVLAEMHRVSRPGARVVIADYGLPSQRLWRGIVLRFVRVYERDQYVEFVGSDLPAELAVAGFVVSDERLALREIVRVVLGHKPRLSPSGP